MPTASLSATERLAQSRAGLVGWLDHDREARAAPGAGWGALAALPALNRLRTHPLASLALGALARVWLRPSPGGTAPALQALVLGAALSVLRRYPKTVVVTAAIAAAALFGARRSQRARSSPSQP